MPLLVVLALLVLAGCSATPAPSIPAAPSARPLSTAKPTPSKGWTLVLEPVAESSRLRVAIDAPSPVEWTLPEAELGAVDVTPRHVAYEVEAAGGACPFEVTPDRAFFCGEAVLPKRATDEPVDIAIELRGGSYYPRAASSHGIGDGGRIHTTFAALHRAGFVFGRVHHAEFFADVGRDHAAWVGFFGFDPRWVAAEAAGFRTSVDRWLGIRRPEDDPTVGLILAGVASTPSVRIEPLRRGAFIFAGPSASWDVRARLDITRLWVQRTLGTAITVDHPQARCWFDEGLAHGVALVVLRDAGVLTPEEIAAEVSGWLVAEAFADEGDRALGIRGALMALALDGAGALQPRLRAMLGARAEGGPRVAPLDALLDGHNELRAALDGARVPLRGADVGPCAVLSRRRVHRFELGFTPSADGTKVESVGEDSAAARAGVAVGDALQALDYVRGASDVPVRATIVRDGVKRSLRYLPRGESRRTRLVTVDPRCE